MQITFAFLPFVPQECICRLISMKFILYIMYILYYSFCVIHCLYRPIDETAICDKFKQQIYILDKS